MMFFLILFFGTILHKAQSVAVHPGVIACDNEATQIFVKERKRCCTECGPGHGAVLICTGSFDTKCEACVPGYFSAERSYDGACEQCRRCPANSIQTSACNSTHPTKCECREGFVFVADDREELCHPVNSSLCPANHHQYNDTQCKPCTICGEEQTEIVQCSSRHDRICTDSHRQPHPTIIHNLGMASFISLIILIAVILSLLCYVIYRTRCVKRKKQWQRLERGSDNGAQLAATESNDEKQQQL